MTATDDDRIVVCTGPGILRGMAVRLQDTPLRFYDGARGGILCMVLEGPAGTVLCTLPPDGVLFTDSLLVQGRAASLSLWGRGGPAGIWFYPERVP
jgi:hypothetical protein